MQHTACTIKNTPNRDSPFVSTMRSRLSNRAIFALRFVHDERYGCFGGKQQSLFSSPEFYNEKGLTFFSDPTKIPPLNVYCNGFIGATSFLLGKLHFWNSNTFVKQFTVEQLCQNLLNAGDSCFCFIECLPKPGVAKHFHIIRQFFQTQLPMRHTVGYFLRRSYFTSFVICQVIL